MEEKIIAYIQKAAAERQVAVDRDSDLYASGVFDSLGIIVFLSHLQEEFGFEFSPDDLKFENFQTIASVLTWIRDRRGE